MATISRPRVGQVITVVVLIGAAVAAVIGVQRMGYPTVAEPPQSVEAAHLEQIPGTDTKRVTLTAVAAAKIGLQTAPVTTAQVAGHPELAIPYAAVFYDPAGQSWAYVQSQPLVYARQKIAVDSIDGAQAYLTAGPAVGSRVVTVGASALYGSEVGVEEE